MARRSSRAGASRQPRKPRTGNALDAGLRLLALRAHSRVELSRKLMRRGYALVDVESAVHRLTERGFLDDRAFAEAHVRRRSGRLGPPAIGAELAARGVDREVAAEALARLSPDVQLDAARRLAERLCGRKPWAGYREMLNSVGGRLQRRGFLPGVIRAACEAAWRGTGDQAEA